MKDARLEKALTILRRVAEAICKCPDQLRMETEMSAGSVEVTFTANPADTKRLAGERGSTVKHLALLFRMLARDTGKAVRLCDHVPNGKDEPPFEPYVAREDWKRAEVEALLKDTVEALYDLPVEVRLHQHNPYSVKMYATVLGDLGGNESLGFVDKAINVLFIPIGTNAGMKVYAHVQDYTEACAHAERRAASRAD